MRSWQKRSIFLICLGRGLGGCLFAWLNYRLDDHNRHCTVRNGTGPAYSVMLCSTVRTVRYIQHTTMLNLTSSNQPTKLASSQKKTKNPCTYSPSLSRPLLIPAMTSTVNQELCQTNSVLRKLRASSSCPGGCRIPVHYSAKEAARRPSRRPFRNRSASVVA